MSNWHIVHVPVEWCALSIKHLRAIIRLEVLTYLQKTKKIEGTAICLESTVGLLERHNNHIWMKRFGDKQTSPYCNDYFSIFVTCIVPES